MTLLTRIPTGLYGITPEWDDTERLLQAIRDAHRGGLALLQWRRKLATPEQAQQQRQAVQTLCQSLQLPFLINDSWPLAQQLNADGVHLGGNDGDPQEARLALGPQRIIGSSCYNSLELAQQAIAKGVDYVAFGALYGSNSKPNAPRAELSTVSAAKAYSSQHAHQGKRVSVVAIGGITLDNAAEVIAAGADNIATISGLFEAEDVYACAYAFAQLFAAARTH